MMRIGLTGGIGSGKSTVAKLFRELGIPVFNSDLCARDAEKDPNIKQAFKNILGDDIFVDDQLDRVRMRSIVFVDKTKLAAINEVVIPYVSNAFEMFVEENADAPYVMLESAILFETKKEKNFDFIVAVTANEDVRIKRVLTRDKVTLEEVRNKLNNQLSEEERMAKADFTISNNGEDLLDSLDVLTNRVTEVNAMIEIAIMARNRFIKEYGNN